MKRIFSILFALALVLSFSLLTAVPVAATTTYTVDDDWQVGSPPYAEDIDADTDFATIQVAIDASSSGDTIMVAAGTYYEHVTIDKSLTLQGEDRETTIIDGGGTGNVVYVTADHVEISGFTVQNSGSAHFQFHYWGRGESGIFLGESSYSKITDCDVRNGGHGISLQYHSDYNLVENCNAYSNTWNGIMLGLWSSHSVIINCNMWNNNGEGIGLWDWGRNNTISNCNAYSNTGNGIGIHWHRNTVVENCNAWNNGYAGIGFDSTMYCKVENANSCSNDIGVLIYTWGSTRYNTITGCDIYSNTYGILVYDPAGHPYGGNNMIYHNNVIDNTYQAKDGNSYPNTWDDGYPSGGNYWSDYIGVDNFSGPGQNLPGSDEIGDTPYVFDGNQDNYPLMEVQNYMVAQCVATATGTGTACFTSSHGIIVELTAMATPPRAPAVLPHGMFSFNISCIDPGQTVTVTIELPERVPVGTEWWKYQAGSWYWLPIGSDDGDNIITVTLTDGVFPGDEDSVVGQITDDGGPGNPGAVGWETYPVNKVRVLLPWIALLAAIMAGASLLVLRRRRAQS